MVKNKYLGGGDESYKGGQFENHCTAISKYRERILNNER